MSVRQWPGHIASTSTPRLPMPCSWARLRTKALTPALATRYGASPPALPGPLIRPRQALTTTTRPGRRSTIPRTNAAIVRLIWPWYDLARVSSARRTGGCSSAPGTGDAPRTSRRRLPVRRHPPLPMPHAPSVDAAESRPARRHPGRSRPNRCRRWAQPKDGRRAAARRLPLRLAPTEVNLALGCRQGLSPTEAGRGSLRPRWRG